MKFFHLGARNAEREGKCLCESVTLAVEATRSVNLATLLLETDILVPKSVLACTECLSRAGVYFVAKLTTGFIAKGNGVNTRALEAFILRKGELLLGCRVVNSVSASVFRHIKIS